MKVPTEDSDEESGQDNAETGKNLIDFNQNVIISYPVTQSI